eukprot:CAMPEP_0183440514 /NCGR_PEP_ID=MMETSP0370-20130417/81768_1 /TAXON_ID=268820 /ORGANISM="Peridinium aciculiferum, Strain PAER-2" /LENGTH=78 /DNA_ID=CAMNT_0025629391 /DNA_START=5 /DNA_END=237 /DNA_ORIENTATION=+
MSLSKASLTGAYASLRLATPEEPELAGARHPGHSQSDGGRLRRGDGRTARVVQISAMPIECPSGAPHAVGAAADEKIN